VQAACVFLLAILSLLRELPEMKSARPSFACFRRIWLYGAHLQLVALLVLLYDPATRLLLNYFGSLSAVGYFEMATRLIGQVRSLVVSANQVMVPHYANLNITNPETVARVVRANFQILLVVSTIVFSMLSVSSFLIGNLWIGQADAVFIEVYMILIIGYFANTLSAAIYFMNIGTGAALNNVTSWVVMISVNVIGGIFGGYLFGVIGVLVSVSTSLVCGSIVMFAAYSRKGNVRVGTWMSSITIRLAIAGCIVYLIAILYTVMGFPFLNGVATSFVPIGLGVLIWVLFGVGEALIVGQSPLLWVRAMIASLRLQ
jgi:O-antigen/teichoic acid export membrane protein